MRRTIALFSILLAGSCHWATANAAPPPDFQSQILAFAKETSKKHKFDPAELTALLKKARYRQSIIDAITRPAEAKPWHKYRPIFVTDSRAREGVRFCRENQALLEQAEARYGVPAETIVAIIGVETRYGRHAGKYPVIDALATLSFGYPRRSAFFKRQLEEFLLLAREEEVDALSLKGSYAGAMGKPQFIPSSYRAYAVDFDNDGKRDIWSNNADAIGSVAAYFKRHGWTKDAPVTVKAEGAGKDHSKYVKAGMKPSIRLSELSAAGITVPAELKQDSLSSLVRLRVKNGNEYWLGLPNFYVITRYNHSNLYAMAVYQLSRKIVELRKAGEQHVDNS
ncbi:lytic murein transglycosylase B [Solemya velesiana gill symbiont]|uniref:Lytic murein transglycosylase B n=1 Tax=Solemya velesiana gill symbiont TaxID=1918948 RepID=A0A1T2KY86_9GAMM|nr:lytic murein transglycosylase B [Solemya velesiana gill symbiont]OOZ37793.1 lytic murein transglycosylase B [Solemya velesiana gill symbiont]